MKSLKVFLMLGGLMAFGATQTQAQKMSKTDKKNYKTLLKVGTWEAKSLNKNGNPVDFTAYAEMLVDFEKRVIKKKKKKKKVRHVFWVDISGGNRNFDYEYLNDSIQFLNVKNLNDYKVVSVDKEALVMEQELNDDIYRWRFAPAPKDRQIDQAAISKNTKKKRK